MIQIIIDLYYFSKGHKVTEKVIYYRVYTFLEKQNAFYNCQFGFRKNHSTSLALVNAIDIVHQSRDNKKMTIGIFRDLIKAFDLVKHNI